MPTYMDIHDIPGVTAEAVAGAHEADVRVQGQYGVNYSGELAHPCGDPPSPAGTALSPPGAEGGHHS